MFYDKNFIILMISLTHIWISLIWFKGTSYVYEIPRDMTKKTHNLTKKLELKAFISNRIFQVRTLVWIFFKFRRGGKCFNYFKNKFNI